MKKLIELYRKYGISQATLRSLAARVEPDGRSRKDSGTKIWYMSESVVAEYLGGKHRGNSEGNVEHNGKQSSKATLFKEQIAKLETEKQHLLDKLERARLWAGAWKSMAGKLRKGVASKQKCDIKTPDKGEHVYLNANGVRFHCVTQGKGPLLILLHGFPEFWYSWRSQIPVLSPHFRVAAIDMRGYNKSDKPRGLRNYRMDVLTEDVRELILAFGEKKAFVAGHDWGGAIAWKFAMDYPDHIEKLAVLNCPHPVIFRQHLFTNFRQFLRSWYMLAFQLPWVPDFLILRNPQNFLKAALSDSAIRKEAFTEKDIDIFCKAILRPRAITAALNYYRAAFWQYRRQTGSSPLINCPSLLIWGENDAALGKELTYDMERYFSSPFELKYIPNCGHFVHQEQPDKVNTYLLEFFLGTL